MRKNLYLVFLLAFIGCYTPAKAQNLDFAWAKAMGGTNSDGGSSMTIDASGNIYTTGYFRGTVDFDPGVGVLNLTSVFGSADIFVCKLDVLGNLIWAKAIGGSDLDNSTDIAIDALGNIYITGTFRNSADFDPSAAIFQLSSVGGTTDTFVCKLDASGNFVWAKAMGGTTNQDGGFGIAVDVSGNVYTTGYFANTVDFDPGTGTQNISSVAETSDIFVSKLDASGNFVWVKTMGGSDSDSGGNIATDVLGNIYISGVFAGTVDFDPNAGVQNLSSVSATLDVFISKLDASGNFIWAKSMGGSNGDSCSDMTIDAAGNVYTTGDFYNTCDFDPGVGTLNITSAGSTDIFISKLNSSGNFVWAKALGGINTDRGNSIAVDASGNVYTTGYFGGVADFDPNTGIQNLTSIGNFDIFISKLDVTGNFVSAKSIGGTGNDQSNGLAIDGLGNIYTTGFFNNTVDFDPNAGVQNFTSAGNSDIFVTKYTQCSTTITISTASLPNGTQGIAYNQTLAQTGLTGTPAWSVSLGVLPAGLSLAPTTGIISGIPTAVGTSNFTVQVTSGGCSQTKAFSLVINQDPLLAIDNTLSNQVKVYPNPANTDFSVDMGSLSIGTSTFVLYDGQGKPVKSFQMENNQKSISLSEFAAGIYLLEINTSKGRILKRIVKI
jgi:hypothetical protein